MAKHIDEQFSSFMDGELDLGTCESVIDKVCSDETLKQKWHRYHLISDSLRSKLPHQLDHQFSESIMQALESEPHHTSPADISNHAVNHAVNNASENNASENNVTNERLPENVAAFSPYSKSETDSIRPIAANITSPVRRRIAGFAIAASVATLAVLGVQNSYQPVHEESMVKAPNSEDFVRLARPEIVPSMPSSMSGSVPAITVSSPIGSRPVLKDATGKKIIVNKKLEAQLHKYLMNHSQQVSGSRIQGAMPYARIVVSPIPMKNQVQR